MLAGAMAERGHSTDRNELEPRDAGAPSGRGQAPSDAGSIARRYAVQVRTTIRDDPLRALTFAHEVPRRAETLPDDPTRSPTGGTQQLYFERRGLLRQLATAAGAEGTDARQLEQRAAELAAGLDSWTGGWFSEVHAARSDAGSENAPE